MKRIGIMMFVFISLISCQSKTNNQVSEKKDPKKKEGIMEEYYKMKADLEPQGYIISTDSVDKIFIDHEVTINYHDKKSKK